MKDYQGAADIYKNLYESTNDFAAGYNYATMLQILYHFDEAEELYKKLQEVNPKDNNLKNAIKRFPEDKANYEILKSRNQVQ